MRLSACALVRVSLVLLFAGGAAGAIAQESGNSKALASTDEWVRMVGQMFDKADGSLKSRGYAPASMLYTSSLNAGRSERVKIDLDGKQSAILGMCDQDCSDFNLQLLDPNGNVAVEDVESDDVPVIMTTGSGSYTLVVTMVKCSAEPCRYGLKQYVK